MTRHLTHEQLCDLLLAASPHPPGLADTQHQEHIQDCLICASELDLLRTAVSRFRYASLAYAVRESARRPLPSTITEMRSTRLHRHAPQPFYWAAAVLLAAVLPFSLHRMRPTPAPHAAPAAITVASVASTESDEALLEGINQDLSASIPSPMQPLADPTASATQALPNPQTPDRTQGKN